MRLLELIARRYIAGSTAAAALEAAKRLNSRGISATIDNLGENVPDKAHAQASAREYLGLLEQIKAAGVDSTVSLKLTHMGLDISRGLAVENAGAVAKKAAESGNSVCIDMEGSAYTQRTLEIFLELHERYGNAMIAVQSYLYRSAADIKLLIEKNARVRLVKGAYKEPPGIAFSEKKAVDANYEKLMKELLLRGNNPAIATHDKRLVEEAVRFAKENAIPKDRFEFQMLLGIRRSLQERLAREGYRMRVYVPYGAEWLPYTMRRLRERKENVFFVLRNIFD